MFHHCALKRLIVLLILATVYTNLPAYAESTYKVTTPAFQITLNGNVIDNDILPYPLVVYEGITYFPMTWDFANLLGLDLAYDQSTGLAITSSTAVAHQKIALKSATSHFNPQTASVVNYPVVINQNLIDNQSLTYPLLNISDITYFPLTWAFAVDYFHWQYQFSNEEGLVITPLGANTQITPVEPTVDDSIASLYSHAVVNDFPLLKTKQLPSAYTVFENFGTATKSAILRNQGNDNTCWAFAANSLFELAILTKDGVLVDFSEDHLIKHSPIPATYDSGGNFNMASAYYSTGLGPILESEDPYDDGKTNDSAVPKYLLTDYLELHDNLETVKQAIFKYGGALSSITLDDNSIDFYNRHNNSYYNNDATHIVTHDIVLIGWDDSYEAYNFNQTPEHDGAFIALNSWGEDWGDAGLFYISYDDVHILENVSVISGYETDDAKGDIYHYNPTGVTHFEGYVDYHYATGMNIFEAKNDAALYAVSFYTSLPNTKYEVFLDVLDDDVIELTSVLSGIIGTAGYHTIALDRDISLTENLKFNVALKLENEATTFIMPIEAPYPNMSYQVTGERGQSFITLDHESYKFEDLNDYRENANIGIRAFTH